jgi:hypothetical protein
VQARELVALIDHLEEELYAAEMQCETETTAHAEAAGTTTPGPQAVSAAGAEAGAEAVSTPTPTPMATPTATPGSVGNGGRDAITPRQPRPVPVDPRTGLAYRPRLHRPSPNPRLPVLRQASADGTYTESPSVAIIQDGPLTPGTPPIDSVYVYHTSLKKW